MADQYAELRRLKEQWDTCYGNMQELQQRSIDEKRDMSAEENESWDKWNAEVSDLEKKIERCQRNIELSDKTAALDTIDYDKIVRTEGGDAGGETPEQRREKAQERYEDAFKRYARGGMEALSLEQRGLLMDHLIDDPEVRTAQGTTSGSVGGYLIPPGYRTVIVETMKAYGGLLNHANVITTSTGNPLQWPTADDTGNTGSILTENTTASPTNLTFGTRSIGAYMYTSGIVLASLQILQDSAFNLDAYLPNRLGVRLGRAVANHLVNGTGSGQPTGILSGVTVAVTGADQTSITYDNLIDLEHSMDPAYRAGQVRFLFNDQTLAAIRKIKDSMGRPIWLPVPTPGFPATVNGYGYTIDQAMPSPGASATSILFGDFNRGYIVRQVLDMQMIRFAERYMDALQIGYMGFMRLDARPDDPGAVKAFQHHA